MENYYEDPIITLDFASLYPSIMMEYNLCYSTLVTDPILIKELQKDPDSYTITPKNNYFVKARLREGLLPKIL